MWKLVSNSSSKTWWLVGLTVIGAGLRFTNLNWGEPWWFHPDERNIASAVTRLYWPDQMDPEFFAYGSLPIYIIYWLTRWAPVINPELIETDPFAIAIMVSRYFSAGFSVLLIPLLWWFGRRYVNATVGWVAAVLTTFTVGFIQFAHFGTFEMWLTVSRLLLLISCIELARTGQWKWLGVTGLLLGVAISTKVTSLVLLPGIGFSLLAWVGIRFRQLVGSSTKHKVFTLVSLLMESGIKLILVAAIGLLVFVMANPYAIHEDFAWSKTWLVVKLATSQQAEALTGQLLSAGNPEPIPVKSIWMPVAQTVFSPSFVHSINVEGGIARGSIPVFYTRQFTDTVPGWFQLEKIFPWVLSWPVMIVGLSGLGLWLLHDLKRKTLIGVLIGIWFGLQAVFIFSLYVKWTRYVIPLLPLVILSAAWLLDRLLLLDWLVIKQQVENRFILAINILLISMVVGWQLIWALMFTNIYTQTDPRIAAADWAASYFPTGTKFVSEVWDLGITPFNPYFMSNIKLFNFYELADNNLRVRRRQELVQRLGEAEVFVILGRRVWTNALAHPDEFPDAALFYNQLFAEELGFHKVAEFYNAPRLGPWVWQDELVIEETFSVFDHPRVQIWTKSYYEQETVN
jgi:hypothetical protein